jgi:hypothetical protein
VKAFLSCTFVLIIFLFFRCHSKSLEIAASNSRDTRGLL